MDALYHFILALAGGFLLAEGLKMNYNPWQIFAVSILSMVPDIQHLTVYIGIKGIELHGIFIILLPLLAYFLLIVFKRNKKEDKYLIILAVLLFGHILMDTVSGENGVPLFYPFSRTSYLMPENWNIYLFNDLEKPLASTYGIGLALYFGVIGFAALIYRFLSSKACARKTSTRK